jgi:hypothetical protein
MALLLLHLIQQGALLPAEVLHQEFISEVKSSCSQLIRAVISLTFSRAINML